MARTFGCDAPESMEFRVGSSKKLYKLPLAASLPASYSVAFAAIAAEDDEAQQAKTAQEFIIGLLDRYCPGASEALTIGALGELLGAWMDASGEQGATPGE